MTLFEIFAALHVPGDPLVLFNVWDAGSADVVARAGAKAIATGSWSVAAAHGCPDGEGLPLDLALANAARIVRAVELPVTIDFEGGYAVDGPALADNVARLKATGAVGCNFEDGMIDNAGLHAADVQARRIATARAAAGDGFFVNARTDIFLQADPRSHDAAMADAAIARGRAYADAGASGFFVPGLIDLALLDRIVSGTRLPVNAMAFPGGPSAAQFASAGIARISHGPYPYRLAMKALEEAALAHYAAG